MARIRMAYIGGGSTRGAGTMASFIHQGANFNGSEVVLIDLDPERLDLIKRLAERMVKARGLDLTIEATTDRRAGLADCIEHGREPVTRPEHAYHALEIMLAAKDAARDGRAREIASDFPRPDLAALETHSDGRRVHDPRSALI